MDSHARGNIVETRELGYHLSVAIEGGCQRSGGFIVAGQREIAIRCRLRKASCHHHLGERRVVFPYRESEGLFITSEIGVDSPVDSKALVLSAVLVKANKSEVLSRPRCRDGASAGDQKPLARQLFGQRVTTIRVVVDLFGAVKVKVVRSWCGSNV